MKPAEIVLVVEFVIIPLDFVTVSLDSMVVVANTRLLSFRVIRRLCLNLLYTIKLDFYIFCS